jgi:hypothetical protein
MPRQSVLWVARRALQVGLLITFALAFLMASDVFDIPHLPVCRPMQVFPEPEWVRYMMDGDSGDAVDLLCDSGDIVIWTTLIAAVLFGQPRMFLWSVTPTLILVVAHMWLAFDDGLPTIGVVDGSGNVRTEVYWAEIWAAAILYGGTIALASAIAAVCSLLGRLGRRTFESIRSSERLSV